MAKKVVGFVKLQIPAGKANPAPPIGPALGQRGLNIMAFCKEFNAKTQKQIGSIERFVKSGFKFQFRNLAIRNVIAAGLPDKDYDLVYSAGLFDYFTEPVAQMAAQKMLACLKPGGKLIIGNFSTENPCAPFMELWLDWNLIYRSKADLERIFKDFGSKVYVEKEPLGVNLFVVIEK